jgi:hypothetical protein
LVRHPGYSAIAALTLALGLTLSTAVFTYVNAYFQPFPGADVEGVFQVFQSSDAAPFGSISYPDYLDLQSALRDQFDMTASGQPLFAASVRHEDLSEVIFGQAVKGNFFTFMDVELALGRGLTPEDDRPGAPPAAVISHEYWVRRYGSDGGVLGGTLLLNNEGYTSYLKCGILAHGFARARCATCGSDFLVAYSRNRSQQVQDLRPSGCSLPLPPFSCPNPLPSLTSRPNESLLSTPGAAGGHTGPRRSTKNPVVHATAQAFARHACPTLPPPPA